MQKKILIVIVAFAYTLFFLGVGIVALTDLFTAGIICAIGGLITAGVGAVLLS